MFFHIILTDDCNLCCTYCRGKVFSDEVVWAGSPVEIDEGLPSDLSINLEDLYTFLAGDPDACLTFYGGEPLLRSDLVMEIIDRAAARRFMLQTNGLLLSDLPTPYLSKFDTILVSLDGPPDVTDRHRGAGTHGRVMENIRHIREEGFCGELIARMTVAEDTDIFEAVTYLSGRCEHPFTSIHWQLDADFSGDTRMRDFRKWLDESYCPGVAGLVDHWVGEMRAGRGVLRWYPFMQPMEDLLLGRESPLRCGSGHANYTIMTDGSIGPCPVMVGMKEYYIGHIETSHPLNLGKVPVTGECRKCDIRGFCGGRCLYSQIIRPWPDEWRSMVCGSVRNLQSALSGALPEVRSLISEGAIRISDFTHTRYNGCEIIP